MQNVLAWMESTWLSRFILETGWAFPALETLHFFGLILLIGSIYTIDLRFLGICRGVPFTGVMKFLPVTVLGFGINFVTGVMFLFADPFRYYPNLSFRLKMLAVLLAGLNAVWFKYAMQQPISTRGDTAYATLTIKWIAGLSLLLWTSVIIFGRMIPYVE